MLPKCTLPTFLAATFAIVSVHASPLDFPSHGLLQRDNNYGLNCSNAPGKVAGELISQNDIVFNTNLPESGSDQKWMKYLYCTPDTKTYTFFNFGRITNTSKPDPPPSSSSSSSDDDRPMLAAFREAAIQTANYLNYRPDDPVKDGAWTLTKPAHTNVEIHAENREGKLTWGILKAAMSGLSRAMLNYNKADYPLLFQINDGVWGEVGWGYAGFVNREKGFCTYDEYWESEGVAVSSDCVKVAMAGKEEGFQ